MAQAFLSLSQILNQHQPWAISWQGDELLGVAQGQAWHQAEQEWLGSLTALVRLLLQSSPTEPVAEAYRESLAPMGVVLSGPFPVLPDRFMGQRLNHWLLVPEPLNQILSVARPLLPGPGGKAAKALPCDLQMVPLAEDDPLSRERFCLLLTARFSLLLVLGQGADGHPQFQFSFDPAVARQGWQQLRDRIAHTRPPLLTELDRAVEPFPPVAPDYRLVSQYSQLLLQELRQRPQPGSAATTHSPSPVQFAALNLPPRPALGAALSPAHAAAVTGAGARSAPAPAPATGSDTELLKAMAHEIRTPLTTIRTLTRSLLKRQDIADEVIKRLRSIDRECTQQIDRFNLIFRAVELETDAPRQPQSPLSAISLNQLFQDAIPLWQQQSSRRNLTLEVNVPSNLPMVNSDPTMLNQVLTGLIDRFTHSLPPYSHIALAVTLAGHQLKLQFQAQPPAEGSGNQTADPVDTLLSSPFKALGQLLIFQPETGGVSLNLNATKNLFQALGGKLIVRQRPQAGEVLTVFLPLETRTL
ncbi:MAG: sensor histidine kinase [Nodosilinea sp.]